MKWIEAKTYNVNPNNVPGCVHFYRPDSPGQVFIPLCVLTGFTYFDLKQQTMIIRSNLHDDYVTVMLTERWIHKDVLPNPLHPWWSPASSTCSGSCGQSSFGPGDGRCHWSGSPERSASSSQPRSPLPSSPLSWVPRSTACPLEWRHEWRVGPAVTHFWYSDNKRFLNTASWVTAADGKNVTPYFIQ